MTIFIILKSPLPTSALEALATACATNRGRGNRVNFATHDIIDATR
jgi:hypothetical protein